MNCRDAHFVCLTVCFCAVLCIWLVFILREGLLMRGFASALSVGRRGFGFLASFGAW